MLILTFPSGILYAVQLTGDNYIPLLASHLCYFLVTRLDRGQKQNISNRNQELEVGWMLGKLELLLNPVCFHTCNRSLGSQTVQCMFRDFALLWCFSDYVFCSVDACDISANIWCINNISSTLQIVIICAILHGANVL